MSASLLLHLDKQTLIDNFCTSASGQKRPLMAGWQILAPASEKVLLEVAHEQARQYLSRAAVAAWRSTRQSA
jgi:hypothetical protein